MRTITDHKVNPANDKLLIEVVDEPGAGGANCGWIAMVAPSGPGTLNVPCGGATPPCVAGGGAKPAGGVSCRL